MSDFVNDLASDLAGAINTVADKVKEYGGYAKLNALIKTEQAKKQEQYYRLGKKYYELYKDAPASDLSEIMDKIIASDEKIKEYEEELKAAKEAGYTDVVDPEAGDDFEDVDIDDIAATVEKEDAETESVSEEENTEE